MRYILDDKLPGGRIERWTGLEGVVAEEAVNDPEAEDVARFRFPLNDH